MVCPTHRTPALIGAALVAASLFGSEAGAVTLDELAKRLDALSAENAQLKAKVEKLEAAQSRQAEQVQKQEKAVETAQHTADDAAAISNAANIPSSTVVSSYGEIQYSRPSHAVDQANVDVGRAVIAITHSFDTDTRMGSEFEFEHAITSSTDNGEAEVEQLWVEHDLKLANYDFHAKAGLFLMPVGLINEAHEPTSYYGVFRPDVDTKIVPSTWREVGLAFKGSSPIGLTWQAGVTTGPNLSKWDPASDEGRVRGPLQAVHGEGQFAAARDPLFHVALNWRGIPGLLVGGSVVTGNIGQDQPNFAANSSRLLMLDLHTRYDYGNLQLAAEFIRASISSTERLNQSFIDNAAGSTTSTLVPSLFYGGYGQAAYRLWHDDSYSVIPFVRYELLNSAAAYGSLATTADAVPLANERIWTWGSSLFIGQGVVLKADYRKYLHDVSPSPIPPGFTHGDSLNLGIGYSF